MFFKAGREMRQGAEACHIGYFGDIVLSFDNQFGSPVEFVCFEEDVGIHDPDVLERTGHRHLGNCRSNDHEMSTSCI